jgi:hypothetical protein
MIVKSRIKLAKFQKTLISKIVNLCRFTQFRKSFVFLKSASHFHIATLNDLASRIRKNMRKSDLIGNYEREIRRGFPAIDLVSRFKTESNRMPVLNSAAARLGQALRETQDVLVRDAIEATASVINCVGGTNGDLPTEMTVSDIDDVVTVLQNNSAEYITNIVEADLKFGTSPVGDSYGCMLSTRMIPVLNNMTGFIRKFQYPRIDQTLKSEGVFKPLVIDLEAYSVSQGNRAQAA